jgi:diguanylate cyclase (GGDEF)-like protein/PAS domain S-box-containing protein
MVETRILLLEDYAPDADLELRELRRAGLQFSARTVETEADFRAALQDFDPHVVLSDYSLPSFSGMAALAILRELRPDVPFIFVSGTLGEESAVEALRSGATDYVLKTNLKRFAAAVQRAITEARDRQARRKAEQRARLLETQFTMFMQNLPASAFIKDAEGRFVFVNPGFLGVAGVTPEKMLGRTTTTLYPPEYVEAILENDRRVLQENQAIRNVERVNFGGADRHFLVTKFPIPGADGRGRLLGGIAVEITDRLKMEEALKSSEERFRGIVETTEEWVWECDVDGRMTYNNPAIEKILGYSPVELEGMTTDNLVDERDRQKLRELVARAVAAPPRWHNVPLRWRSKEGTVRWLESSGAAMTDADGKVTGFRGTDRDITERVLKDVQLQRLSRIREVLGSFSSAIIRLHTREELLDELCRIAVAVGGLRMAWAGVVEAGADRITNVAAHGAIGGFLDAIDFAIQPAPEQDTLAAMAVRRQAQQIVNRIDGPELPQHWREQALSRGFHAAAALPIVMGSRVAAVAVLFASEPGFFDDDQLKLLANLSADASVALERLESQARVDYLSYYDTLTGAANRTLLMDRLALRLQESARDGRKLALMILDIERFRLINESMGRGTGDQLLKLVAQQLRDQLDAQRIARVGMNSFAVVMPDLADDFQAARQVEEMRRALSQASFQVDGRDLRISVRCGVAVFPDNGDEPDTLLQNAEAALARAKQAGEATVYYTPMLNAHLAERLAFESRLRLALEQRQFVLHYQPKVSLATGEILGLEALMRWNDPAQGLVLPTRFIPILEETGMIVEVGQWALAEAARVYRKWKTQGLPAARIAVNVSAIQLRSWNFVDHIRQLLAENGPDAGIDIEITESMVMQDLDRSARILGELRDAGMSIAMDDFGTGYSSLGYLVRLPVDTIKIDRSFISTMTERQNHIEVAAAIISMAHSLGMRTVAEGVETERQRELLSGLGCHEIQGYLVSRPVPEAEIEKLLAASAGKRS